MFWEDINQAAERLTGTYVVYGDMPVFIDRIKDVPGSSPHAQFYYTNDYENLVSKPLEDPLFHDFHRLPPLGYVNTHFMDKPLAVHLSRVPDRSRFHGLRDQRITTRQLSEGGAMPSYEFRQVVKDPGYYGAAMANSFPSAQEILENLSSYSSAAFARQYAIYCDLEKVYHLYRRTTKVGVVSPSGVDLTSKAFCYREELEETETFNIRLS